jgi:hypothetical protein
MRVSGLKLEHGSESNILSAYVGDYLLWFRTPPNVPLLETADPFLTAALLPSMLEGSALEVTDDLPVSTALLANLTEIQEIFHCWNPALKRIPVRAGSEDRQPCSSRVGSFYSGGVDSNHTFLRKRDEITDLVIISGFDFDMDAGTFESVLNRIRPFADSFGKELVPVETNFFHLERAFRMMRTLSHGSCLAAIAQALAFRTVYVPSSHPYSELFAWGSHPITDHLWSNGGTELIHDGAGSKRTEKILEIAGDRRILDSLIVCWNKPNENCGTCGKCVRTMTTFRSLGITSPVLPPLTDLNTIRRLRAYERVEIQYLFDNIDLAEERGDTDLAAALASVVRRYELRIGLVALERSLLGGRLKKIYRHFRPLQPPERIGFPPRRGI